MKILFVTDLYPIKKGESHTPLTLHNFVIEWTKSDKPGEGHCVDVIKPNFLFNSFVRNKPIYPTGFYEFEGVKIFNVNYFTPFLFNIKNKLDKSIDIASYDVIIAHMPSGIIFANKLAKEFKIQPNVRFICGVHSSDIEVLTSPIYKLYFQSQLKDAYKNANKIACRSFVLQKKFNELMPELAGKTFVAASGVDGGKREKEKGKSDDKLRVLSCANLIKRKNIDKLILAMNDLEGFELTIIGDGKELKNLKKMALNILLPLREKVGEARMRGKVNFLGHLPREKVLEEMQKADIFILPSVNETFGMVYLEAMASGCITVCTKNDGIEGIIKDGENGFLCEPTSESIKETILKIKSHENLEQIRQNAFATIKEYSPENCAKNYLKNL